MKNKNRKIKFILVFVALAILIILISYLSINNNINKEEKRTFSFNIAGLEVLPTDELITDNPNEPQLGAGMIPIKYVDGVWQITTEDDTEWYDYANGKMAAIMLSDGYYVSEIKQDIGNHEVASEHIGTNITEENLGTIYLWLPRFVQIGEDGFKYLKDYSVVDYINYVTPKCFLYKKDGYAEFAFKGIWIEKSVQSSQQDTNNKINSMSNETNDYGLIKNEIVDMYAKEAVDSLNIYQSKYKKQKNMQQVDDIENTNRTMIRIVSTNNYVPLTIRARSIEKVAHITTYSVYGISKILYLDSDTNTAVQLNVIDGTATMEVPKESIYDFVAIDNVGNIQMVTLKTIVGIPDLTGFKLDSTYIVTYGTDSEGNIVENSSIPIKKILKDGYRINKSQGTLISGEIDVKKKLNIEETIGEEWFNYKDSKWANIVVRNNGNEAYFVWIPRYVYKLNSDETTQIKFVTVDNQDSDGVQVDLTEWTLPEAFTWKTDTETVQLQGFWLSKYELSAKASFSLSADIKGGLEKIIVNNVVDNVGLASPTYEFFVYKYGVDKTELDNAELMNEWQVANVKTAEIGKTDYTFENIPGGTYQVRIVLYSKGIYMGELWKDTVEVDSKGMPNEPDLTGFRMNTTYVVAYNDAGTMDSKIPISDILKNAEDDETLSQNTLLSGSIDEDKVNSLINEKGYIWYDYADSKWANIVIRNGGGESYYTWIPRYIYKLNTNDGISGTAVEAYQTTEIKFVKADDDISEYLDSGWTLPEAFTWKGDSGTKQLNGFWLSKYELTSYSNFTLKVADDSGVIGELNRIRINNITNTLGLNHYKVFLYQTDENSNRIADFENANNIKSGNYNYYAEGVDIPPTEKDEYGVYICDGKNFVRYAEVESNNGANQTTFYNLVKGTYALRIVAYDDTWHYRGESWYYNIEVQDKANTNEVIDVDLTGFNEDVTYYVTFNETTAVRGNKISGSAPSDWYDYDNSKWANIVVNGNNKTAYFVWIPRYAYKVDNIREETLILFLKPDDPVPTGWTLPVAFKWQYEEDGTTKTKQLKGYWLSKYELSAG